MCRAYKRGMTWHPRTTASILRTPWRHSSSRNSAQVRLIDPGDGSWFFNAETRMIHFSLSPDRFPCTPESGSPPKYAGDVVAALAHIWSSQVNMFLWFLKRGSHNVTRWLAPLCIFERGLASKVDIEEVVNMPNVVQEEGLACRMVLLSSFALMTEGQSPLCLSLVLQVKPIPSFKPFPESLFSAVVSCELL